MANATLSASGTARKSAGTSKSAPRPISPKAGAPVDAHAPTFEWDGGDGSNFVLEIARDQAFADVVAHVPTASSTSVTLYDVFRPDGARYFWRISADRAGTSDVRSFISAPYDVVSESQEADAARAAKQAIAAAGLGSSRAQEEPVEPPYRTGTTSMRETATVVLVMLVSFVVMAGILFGFSIGI